MYTASSNGANVKPAPIPRLATNRPADRAFYGLLEVADDGDDGLAAIGVRRGANERPPERVGRALALVHGEGAEGGMRRAGTPHPPPGVVASRFAPQAEKLAVQRDRPARAVHHPRLGDEGVADGSRGLGKGSGQLASPQVRPEQLDRTAVGGEEKPRVPAPVERGARGEAAGCGQDCLPSYWVSPPEGDACWLWRAGVRAVPCLPGLFPAPFVCREGREIVGYGDPPVFFRVFGEQPC